MKRPKGWKQFLVITFLILGVLAIIDGAYDAYSKGDLLDLIFGIAFLVLGFLFNKILKANFF